VLFNAGGLYMDHKIMLTSFLSDWINPEENELVQKRDYDDYDCGDCFVNIFMDFYSDII
jgi:hypothetical protein